MCDRVLLPQANKAEVEALETDVTEGLELVLVANAGEVVDKVLEEQGLYPGPVMRQESA